MTMAAELAVAGGWPPPDPPYGECIMTWVYDGDGAAGGICIEQADPRVLVSVEVLDAVNGAGAPGVWLDLAGYATYDGALLKIRGVNRTVIYRIGEYVPRVRGYIGEWPD